MHHRPRRGWGMSSTKRLHPHGSCPRFASRSQELWGALISTSRTNCLRRAEWKPDDAIFSFVRSPLEMALSAYLEVSRRADGMSASKGVHAAYRNMSCASLSSSTDRFEAYLGDLEAGRPLGGEAVHSFPQAFKIYFPRPTARSRRFSAIGKLENLSDHLGQMRALFFTSELGGSSLAQFQHSGRADARGKGSTRHEGSQCSHIDWQRQSLLLRLCRVYLADFHCFNYSMPAECQEMSIQ